MDHSWLEQTAEELRSISDNHVYESERIFRNCLAKVWDQVNLRDNSIGAKNTQSEFYPMSQMATLMRIEETIDDLLGSKEGSPSLERFLQVGDWSFQNICREFYSGIIDHAGDTERCAAFILRYQHLFSLVIVNEIVQLACSKCTSKKDYHEILACALETFFPEICENEQQYSRLLHIFQEKILMGAVFRFAISFLSCGNLKNVVPDTKVQEKQCMHRRRDVPTELQMLVYEKSHISSYADTNSNGSQGDNLLKEACTQRDMFFAVPCKDLFYFCKAFLDRGFVASKQLSAGMSQEITDAVQNLRCECSLIEIFNRCDEWKNICTDYVLWRTKYQDAASVISFNTEIDILSKAMETRVEYEKRVRKYASDTSTWIEYIMWEFNVSQSLHQEIQSHGLSDEVPPSYMMRPLAVCERALIKIGNINLGKALLCTSMDAVSCHDKERLGSFIKSWKACSPSIEILFDGDQVSAKTFRPSFEEECTESWSCGLSTCLPVWIQYIALVRLLLEKTKFQSGHRNSLDSLIGFMLPSLISRAIRNHPDSEDLLSECVFLAYFYQKHYAKYWMSLEKESFIMISPSRITQALVNTKLLYILFSNWDRNCAWKTNDVFSTHSYSSDISALRKCENTRRIKGPTYRRCNNLIVFFYLLGVQSQSFGSVFISPQSDDLYHDASPSSYDIVVPKFIGDIFAALKKVIHIKGKGMQNAERDEITNSIFFFMLAVRALLQEMTSHCKDKITRLPKSLSLLIEMAKKLTSNIDVSLIGYDTSSYLDFTCALYQSYGNMHSELGQMYRKTTAQKINQANKAYKKSKNVKPSADNIVFNQALRSLYCAINKRLKWDHIDHFSSFSPNENFVNLPSEQNGILKIWQDIMQQSMEHQIMLSDEFRVSLQKVDIAFWVSSIGDYRVFIDTPPVVNGTEYVCMRNIPSPLQFVDLKKAGDDIMKTPLSKDLIQLLQIWLAPFHAVSFPKFCYQKNQIIVVVQFLTKDEAYRCAVAKNRTAWTLEKQFHAISVQHVQSSQELNKLYETIGRRKRRIKDERILQSYPNKNSDGNKGASAKSNKYFSELFSKTNSI